MDDWPPWYPGAWSTWTIEPKYGAAGAAAAGVATMPGRARATRANTIGRTKVALDPRELGDRSMVRALLRSPPFVLRYLTRVGRFSKMRISCSRGCWKTAALVRYLHSTWPTTPAGEHAGGAPRDAG